MVLQEDEPCFTIGVVHQMLGLHPQTLRHYERLGLVRPQPLTARSACTRPRTWSASR